VGGVVVTVGGNVCPRGGPIVTGFGAPDGIWMPVAGPQPVASKTAISAAASAVSVHLLLFASIVAFRLRCIAIYRECFPGAVLMRPPICVGRPICCGNARLMLAGAYLARVVLADDLAVWVNCAILRSCQYGRMVYRFTSTVHRLPAAPSVD
jgi:hypothetical protein